MSILLGLQEGHKHYMPETKLWSPSRCMHYFKVLCARGTAYSTVYLHILALAKRNTSVANDKYRRLETDTDSTLATEASFKLPLSLAKQSWQTSLAVKYHSASTLVSDGACSRLEFELTPWLLDILVALHSDGSGVTAQPKDKGSVSHLILKCRHFGYSFGTCII